jgi:acyl-coenzyme A synthetase/AMP-(fatty) acid ligase
VVVVDALPRTASGKADLAAVRELVADTEVRA